MIIEVSPIKLLMNRQLRGKLPDRDALHKLKCIIIVNQRRIPKDQVMETRHTVLCKTLRRTNNLEPIFEVQPHKIVEKRGNAVIVKQPQGKCKMRNAAIVKRFDFDTPYITDNHSMLGNDQLASDTDHLIIRNKTMIVG